MIKCIRLWKRVFPVAVVAFVAMWNCRVEGNKFEDREVGKAKEEKFLAVKFEEESLPPLPAGGRLTPKTFSAYAMSISGVSDATAKGMPALVYFYAQKLEILPDKIKDLNLKQPVKRCAKLEERCFLGKNVAIGTMAKLFFRVKIDITNVVPKENRMFNVFNAPLVLMMPPDDGVVKFLSGKELNESDIESEMTKILRGKKINVSKILKDTGKMLPRIRALEAGKRELRRDRRKMKIKLKDAEISERRSRIVGYKKKQEYLQGETEKNKKELSAVYDEFNSVLREASTIALPLD